MRICFVAHFAYGALAGGKFGHVGGVERQTSLMGKWFAERGHEVTVLTWDEGQESRITTVDGIRVITICKKDSGIPGLRFFVPRWSGLVEAMRLADADVYYQNCAEYVTGQVALWTQKNKKKFIFSVPSDPDCDARLPKMSSQREKILYKIGLQKADRIIVQTEYQKELLQQNFSLPSLVIPMPCPGMSEEEYVSREAPERDKASVLWVGRVSKEKRLEAFIDLAAQMDHLQFDVAGGPFKDVDYDNRLVARAKQIPNITLHGVVERSRMDDFYKNASMLCCTSSYEGFPNTYLEAWNHGLPVVTTIDPDNIIERNSLGFGVKDISDLASKIDNLTSDKQLWEAQSQNAREYFVTNHMVDNVMGKFQDTFLQTMENRV